MQLALLASISLKAALRQMCMSHKPVTLKFAYFYFS